MCLPKSLGLEARRISNKQMSHILSLIEKKNRCNGLTSFTDERTAKILLLNVKGKFGLDFIQFTSFDLPIWNHTLNFGSSSASNREFAYCALNQCSATFSYSRHTKTMSKFLRHTSAKKRRKLSSYCKYGLQPMVPAAFTT